MHNSPPAVVVDSGSLVQKWGVAGNHLPQCSFPSLVAHRAVSKRVEPTNHSWIWEGQDPPRVLYAAEDARRLMASPAHLVQPPIVNGIVVDWDGLEMLWLRGYMRYLRCDPSAHPAVLTHSPLISRPQLARSAEVFFEAFNVPKMMFAADESSALHGLATCELTSANGRRIPCGGVVPSSFTGVLLLLGASSRAVAVVNGFPLLDIIQDMAVGGEDVTHVLEGLLRKSKQCEKLMAIPATPSGQWHSKVFNQVKEATCYVAEDYNAETFAIRECQMQKTFCTGLPNRPSSPPASLLRLQVAEEMIVAPEVLFNPRVASRYLDVGSQLNWQPLQRLVDNLVQQSPIDSRRELYGNIVVIGGNSLLPGIDVRLKNEIQAIVDQRQIQTATLAGAAPTPVVVDVWCPRSRLLQADACWCGASLLGSSVVVSDQYFPRAAYDEYGADRLVDGLRSPEPSRFNG